ncbi:MAG: hypothetical protein ABI723_26565 [Bacteroidia bacterium]
MKVYKKYSFKTWNEWQQIVDRSAKNFSKKYSVYPMLLVANKHTLSQLDFIVQIRPDIDIYLRDKNTGEEFLAQKKSDEGIGNYANEDIGFNLSFCYALGLKDREFLLAYTDEEDGDNDDDDDNYTPVLPDIVSATL